MHVLQKISKEHVVREKTIEYSNTKKKRRARRTRIDQNGPAKAKHGGGGRPIIAATLQQLIALVTGGSECAQQDMKVSH